MSIYASEKLIQPMTKPENLQIKPQRIPSTPMLIEPENKKKGSKTELPSKNIDKETKNGKHSL